MIKIYSEELKKLKQFEIKKDKPINIYLCGPTVYNTPHIGNLRPVIVLDSVVSYLVSLGYRVNYISNITDIDDKIIKRAKEEGKTPEEISKKYSDEYFKILKDFKITYPKTFTFATGYISKMEEAINIMIDKGYAYEKSGDVYFRVNKVGNYGIISGQKVANLKNETRQLKETTKEDPLDFTLWKKTSDTPQYKTKFSKGRPGWHTECAVMCYDTFKDTLDIHAGGMDLKFPHHENENAQYLALTGKPLAKFWLHIGLISYDNSKMSKSKGNIILAPDLLKMINPLSYRLLLLAHRYDQPINLNKDLLLQYDKEYTKIIDALNKTKFHILLNNYTSDIIDNDEIKKFNSFMEENFNTQMAVTQIFELVKKLNKANDIKEKTEYFNTIIMILKVLGFNIKLKDYSNNVFSKYKEWELAKSKKDYKTADKIRDELIKLGVL